jgi:hypothetical protein
MVVKILTPTPLLAEAADVLSPVRDIIIVVGAAAGSRALRCRDSRDHANA